MGSGASEQNSNKTTDKSNVGITFPYAERQRLFLKRHSLFISEVLSKYLGNEIEIFELCLSREVEENINILYNKYKTSLDRTHFNEYSFKHTMYELYGDHIIKKRLLTINHNIFNAIEQVYIHLDIGDMENEIYKSLIVLIEKEFERNLNFVDYTNGNFPYFPTHIQMGVNRQLKFTFEYQPNILLMNVNDEMLINRENINDICDLIANCPALRAVILTIYPIEKEGIPESYGLSCKAYQSLYKLIDAVGKNKKIKAFFFHSIRNYGISLAPEIFMKIIAKLQSETLIAFHLGNFILSNSLMDKMTLQLANTKELKFLSLHLDNINKILMNKVLPSIKSNRSLLAFYISNLNKEFDGEIMERFNREMGNFIKEQKDKKKKEIEKGVQVKTSNIEIFALGFKSIVNIIEDKKVRKRLTIRRTVRSGTKKFGTVRHRGIRKTVKSKTKRQSIKLMSE